MDVLSQGGSNKMRKACHRPFPSFSAVQVAVPADLDKEMPAVSHPISQFGGKQRGKELMVERQEPANIMMQMLWNHWILKTLGTLA